MRYTALVIAALCVAVFLLQPYFDTDQYSLVASDVMERPWTLVTSMFLHGSGSHLLGNMFALGLFGFILENIIGTRKFLAVYFASGIISGMAAIFFYDAAIGASGAIFGVMGMLAAIRPRMMVWTYGVPMPMMVAAGFWLVLDIAGAFYPSNIANMAHIAGLLFGIAVGYVSGYRQTTRKKHGRTISDEEFGRWEDDWLRR